MKLTLGTERAFLARVRGVVTARERWFGELDVDSLLEALAIDSRTTGLPLVNMGSMSDDAIVEAAASVRAALRGGSRYTLPFGTVARAGRPGSVEIGGRFYVKRSFLPGLYPAELVRRDAYGPNLETLRSTMYASSSRTTSERIGFPSPSLIGDRGSVRHLLEFPPLAEAGGAVLQFDVERIDAARFCAAPMLQLERFASSLLKGAHWLWRRRAAIGQRVGEARRAARSGLAAEGRRAWSADVARICVDARSVGRPGEPALVVEYMGLDDALRRGRIVESVPAETDLRSMTLMRAPALNARRRRELGELERMGADGRISPTAAAVARAAPEGECAVLERLARSLETMVTVPDAGGPFFATLFWKEGVIHAEAATARELTLWRDPGDLPPRPTAVFSGSKRSDEAEPLPKERSRRCSEAVSRGSVIETGDDPGTFLVNTATGTMWPEPRR